MQQRILKSSPLRIAAALWLVVATTACGSSRASAQTASSGSSASSAESLDTLVAPIALYPDALVADVLAASTYPVQVVESGRAVANGAKPTASDMSQWDKSIQALVEFPSVLTMMSSQLTWTTQLGQAVSQSQANVMAAVQRVRAEAQKAGNLQSNDKQTVTTQASTIIIEPANPQVIYVPQYNPVTIIEPAPAYVAAPVGYGLMTFGVGFAAGALTAYACDWGHGYGGGSININNNYNYNNVNNYNHNTNVNNVNANKYSSWKAPTNVGHISNNPVPANGSGLNSAHHDGTAPNSARNPSGDHYGSGQGSYGGEHNPAPASPHNYGGSHASDGSGGMFGGSNGEGWSSRAASDRGAQSFGGGGYGHGFGNFRGGGGSFQSGGHRRY
ncbi:MAG: DUF3300 domain-containing protein [bacterium]